MTRCITPVLLVTGILGCGLTPSHGAIDDDIVDDFAIATDTAGDDEGSDLDFSDDVDPGTTGPADEETVDDFTLATDTSGPDEATPVDDLAAASEWYPL